MTAIDTNSIDTVLVWVERAKKVFMFNAHFEDHVRLFKGEFQGQLAEISKEEGDMMLRSMRVELDEFGNLWLD